jgi:hypothetical protein
MRGLDGLREDGRMTWAEAEHGWVAAPEDIVDALGRNGAVPVLGPDPYTEDGGES